jgi:3-oxoacyl-[acyl-carrier protein] reductase
MKKVVITGGSGDIAKAIANELEGSYEIFLPTRKELNVTDLDQINKYISKIKPDILINNAGAIKIQSIKENDMATQKNIIDVNLTGVFACTGAALQNNPNAKIINIGSSAGTTARADWSSYCATKAAVIMATKCWADEGVDTVCISPGRTMTQMRASMYPDEDKTTLMTPEDFAKVVVRAINGDYERGSNLDVNVNNVGELINA